MPKRFGPRYRVPYRRRKEGRTDYRARYRMLLSKRIRAVVRKSLRHVIVQFVKAELGGDKTLVTARSLELKKYGWKYGGGNIPAAYLTGYLAGLKAIKAGISDAILDIGPQRAMHGGRLFAVLRGLVDAGLEIPHNPEVFPSKQRITGEHIAEYYDKIKRKKKLVSKQFGGYLSRNAKPSDIPKNFEETLAKIAEAFGVEPPSLEDEEEFEEEMEEEFEEN